MLSKNLSPIKSWFIRSEEFIAFLMDNWLSNFNPNSCCIASRAQSCSAAWPPWPPRGWGWPGRRSPCTASWSCHPQKWPFWSSCPSTTAWTPRTGQSRGCCSRWQSGRRRFRGRRSCAGSLTWSGPGRPSCRISSPSCPWNTLPGHWSFGRVSAKDSE